uniref:Photosystem I reaction center subunit IX n=1 Tax=Spirodela intermedia TaxID=51605 RepID=A0A8S0XWC1_SPIIN
MQDLKTYLSVAPVLSTLWFAALAGLLIEINRLFPDALSFPFLILVIDMRRNRSI